MSIRAALAILVVFSTACSSRPTNVSSTAAAPTDTVSASVRGLPACPDASTTGDWRLIVATGVRFCVPGDWKPGTRRDAAPTASGQWRGSNDLWVRWAVGPWKDTPGMMLPYNEQRNEEGFIGDRAVKLTTLVLPGSFTLLAHFAKTDSLPAVSLTGYARDEAGLALARKVIETAHFDPR